jgi:hypothetical protein
MLLKASDLRVAHAETTLFDALSLTLSGPRRVALAYEAQEKRRRRVGSDIASTRGYAMRSETTASGMGADQQPRHITALKVELEAALRDHPGAIVAVSHERAFLDAIGTTRELVVQHGTVAGA